MARLYSRPVSVQALNEYPLIQEQLWAEATVNGGMVSSIDPADIPDGALSYAKNARVRFDKTSRRFGYSAFTPADSDTAAAIKLATFKRNNGTIYLVKLRPAGPRYTDFSAWFAPTGVALAGAATDRFNAIVTQDMFIFANNGVDNIQQLTIGSPGTFGPLGNAPKAKYLTGFYNRVIAANYTAGGTPVTVGWSGDSNPTVWDSATDPSAGSSPLLESPGDEADYITGVFGFTNVMVVLRERSIWIGTKQPIGTAPFYFYSAIAGVGCNCPYSVAVLPNGLVWLDLATGSVWSYQLGGQPERIGLPIEKTLVAGVSDPTQVFGSYSGVNNEYTCGVIQAGTNVRRLWTHNFRSKAWAFEEEPDIYDVTDTPMSLVAGLAVQDLVGKVSDLVPTVANLVASKPVSTSRLMGKADGTIISEDPTADADSTGPFTTELWSKDFTFPDIDTYVSQIMIEYIAHKGGQIEIDYSRDGGLTWKVGKTITIATLEVPQLLRLKKHVKARRIRWRVLASNGLWDVLSYEVRVFPGGESRK